MNNAASFSDPRTLKDAALCSYLPKVFVYCFVCDKLYKAKKNLII